MLTEEPTGSSHLLLVRKPPANKEAAWEFLFLRHKQLIEIALLQESLKKSRRTETRSLFLFAEWGLLGSVWLESSV